MRVRPPGGIVLILIPVVPHSSYASEDLFWYNDTAVASVKIVFGLFAQLVCLTRTARLGAVRSVRLAKLGGNEGDSKRCEKAAGSEPFEETRVNLFELGLLAGGREPFALHTWLVLGVIGRHSQEIPAAAPALDREGHAVLVLEMAPGDAAAVLAVVGLSADPACDELPLGEGGVGGVCVWVEDEEVVDVEGPAGGGGAGEEAVGAAGAELEEGLAGVCKVGEEDGRGLVGGGTGRGEGEGGVGVAGAGGA